MNVMLTSKSQETVRNQQTNYLLFFSLDGMFQDAAILHSLYEDLSRDLDAHCVCGESMAHSVINLLPLPTAIFSLLFFCSLLFL